MKFSEKIFLIPIIILLINFIYRLINFSTILYRFPLDTTNDLTAYIADIPFFEIYGFFGHVPQWYNGFILFNIYPQAGFSLHIPSTKFLVILCLQHLYLQFSFSLEGSLSHGILEKN